MSIDPKFRTVTSYDTDDQDRLARELSQLEDNIAAAMDRIATTALPKLAPTQLKTSAYAAKLDDLVIASGTFGVVLPVATNQNNGRVVGIVVKSGAITVTSLSKIQNATSDALSAAGLYLYVSTGVDWWRAASGGGSGVSPATTIVTETAFGQASAVGVGVLYARNDHTHGTPATPVTSIAADDATLVFSAATGPVTAHVGVISDANVDGSIVTESLLAAQVKKLRVELQHIRLLIATLVDLELTDG